MAEKNRAILIIHPDGTEEAKWVNKRPTLTELQSYVGGFIEYVRLPLGNGHKQMVVNEEGLLDGLETNDKASRIAGCLIVGNAVIY